MNALQRNLAPCIGASLLITGLAAWADVPVPALRAHVTDTTGTLTGEESAGLEAKLTDLEKAKGSQLAVLIVPTTQPETIEQYSLRVAEAWKLGRKGVDDAAILVVAKDDHRLRIEVGYGLEGVLNDATSKRLISETITPKFKDGDFAGGIDAGVAQMIGLVNGERLPPFNKRGKFSARHDTERGSLEIGPALLVFFVVWWAGVLVRKKLGFVKLTVGAAAAAALASVMLTEHTEISAFFVLFMLFLLLGSAGYLLVAFFDSYCSPATIRVAGETAEPATNAKRRQGRSRKRAIACANVHGGSSPSNSSISSSSSWNSSNDSDSGSSFSGGGGTFGGGGASGTW